MSRRLTSCDTGDDGKRLEMSGCAGPSLRIEGTRPYSGGRQGSGLARLARFRSTLTLPGGTDRVGTALAGWMFLGWGLIWLLSPQT